MIGSFGASSVTAVKARSAGSRGPSLRCYRIPLSLGGFVLSGVAVDRAWRPWCEQKCNIMLVLEGAVPMIADTWAVAFDLDMTLVDSRPVSWRALERLVSEHGYDLHVESLMVEYGLPLSRWLPIGDHALFRSLQMQEIASAESMPGALAAVAAVRSSGGRVVVVTAASGAIALEMLGALGLAVAVVRADVWGAGKVEPLREENCWAFVGDHADDMAAARRAGAIAIGVATGMSRPVGADVELEDLNGFAPWLARRPRLDQRPSR
jgi:phosphoglycolate phosphatase